MENQNNRTTRKYRDVYDPETRMTNERTVQNETTIPWFSNSHVLQIPVLVGTYLCRFIGSWYAVGWCKTKSAGSFTDQDGRTKWKRLTLQAKCRQHCSYRCWLSSTTCCWQVHVTATRFTCFCFCTLHAPQLPHEFKTWDLLRAVISCVINSVICFRISCLSGGIKLQCSWEGKGREKASQAAEEGEIWSCKERYSYRWNGLYRHAYRRVSV